jgi:hypothetical protein
LIACFFDRFLGRSEIDLGQQREAGERIADENLNMEAANRYISASLKREYAGENERNSTVFCQK